MNDTGEKTMKKLLIVSASLRKNSNSWVYTRLGRITDKTANVCGLAEGLGGVPAGNRSLERDRNRIDGEGRPDRLKGGNGFPLRKLLPLFFLIILLLFETGFVCT